MDKITTTYKDVEIEYDEYSDLWRFHARGRERSAKSLKNAKATIDKPDPGEKKAFKPVEAYLLHPYHTEFEKVTVTSIAENSGRGREVWITKKNGGRSKQVLDNSIYAVSPENDKILQEIRDEEAKVTVARRKQEQLRRALEHLVIDNY